LLMTICRGSFDPSGKWNLFDRFELDFYRNLKENKGTPIRLSLNMFDVFNSLDEGVKTEMFEFTMPLQIMLIRALLHANFEKKFFIDQNAATGFYSKSMEVAYYKVFPNNRFAVRSSDPIGGFTQFDSPWAAGHQDEQFFSNTLKTIGHLVKDDTKLGTLYSTLIFATPGENSSEQAKTCQALISVQKGLAQLIFRYLKEKLQDIDVANETTTKLIKCITDLHTCRDIHMLRRIRLA